MRVIRVPARQLNVETNLRFSRDHRRFGPPPRLVRIGSEVQVEFDDPVSLTAGGVYLDPGLVKLLVRSVPGFKRIAW